MNAPMNVRIDFGIIFSPTVKHGNRFLRSGSIIKINQGFTIDGLGKNRKLTANILNVEHDAYLEYFKFTEIKSE